jgi:hypothetical protein
MNRLMMILAPGLGIAFSLLSQTEPPLEIKLSPDESTVSMGEPVIVRLTAKNNSAMPTVLDLGLNREGALQFQINAPDGSSARVSAPLFGSAETLLRLSHVQVAPAETYSQSVRLSGWYPFSKVGAYLVTGSIVGMPSATAEGTFTITITAADPERLRMKCAQLLAKAMDSMAPGAADAGIDLGQLRDPIAVPYLIRLLAAQPVARASAIEGLGRIGNLDAIQGLLNFFGDANEEDRGHVTAVLTAVEASTVNTAVRERIRTSGVVRR